MNGTDGVTDGGDEHSRYGCWRAKVVPEDVPHTGRQHPGREDAFDLYQGSPAAQPAEDGLASTLVVAPMRKVRHGHSIPWDLARGSETCPAHHPVLRISASELNARHRVVVI